MKKGLITIRRRKEPVEVDEHRARKVKLLRFGDVEGNGKADPDTDIDLGDAWSGKIDQIVSVEIVSPPRQEVEHAKADPEKEWKEHEARLLKQTPEQRIGELGKFKVAYFMRSKFTQKEPPEKVLAEARKIGIAFFRKNPNVPVLPNEIFEPVFSKAFGPGKAQSLAESKKVVHS